MLRKCTTVVPTLSRSLCPAMAFPTNQHLSFCFSTPNKPTTSKTSSDINKLSTGQSLPKHTGILGNIGKGEGKVIALEEEFGNKDLEELMMEEAGIKEKMYFLKMVGIILMINVIARLMVQKDKPFKSYERQL